MTKTIKIILIALAGVMLLAGIMFLIWALMTRPAVIFKPAPAQPAAETTEPLPTGGSVMVPVSTTTQEVSGIPFEVSTSAEAEKQAAKNLCILFAERFGSFSNQGSYENITDLLSVMTPSMRVWAENYVSKNASAAPAEYYGVSTKVVANTFNSYDAAQGNAVMTLDTQRREMRASVEDRIYYQAIRISLKKIDGAWLVDSASWQ
ncbi:MAG: hypothetical protein PHW53_02415 [Patescibacteria group bacterium]|nr:hypothetical protein [Patescibacteria group bacterium]